MNTTFIWIARHGALERGVLIRISDQLQWVLQPPANSPGDLLRASLQLGIPFIQEALVGGVEHFFAGEGDVEFVLTTHNTDGHWDAGKRLD